MTPEIEIIILAAGKGTRMNSKLPKVLHEIGGEPMLQRVINTAKKLNPKQIQVVIGHGAELIKQKIHSLNINWVLQKQQLGTGHAVKQTKISDDSINLVLYGDVPLIDFATLKNLVAEAQKSGFALLTTKLSDPTGYGRIVRKNNKVQQIVEHKDASENKLKINEINTGIMAVSGKLLKKYLGNLSNNNSQKEFYLTEIVAMAVTENIKINSLILPNPEEAAGINDRQQQANLERYLQLGLAKKLMNAGVTIYDPKRLDIRGNLTTGKDVIIDINAVFIGEVKLGDNVTIGANTTVKNCTISNNCTILENSVLENSTIGENCNIGPFARIRPNTILKGNNKVGNFVEIKKSTIEQGSKVNHLSYIGDTKMGQNVNIGAGTITCNYDGANKNETNIGNEVFVGSGTQLVAPIDIAAGTTIGAGSTLIKNVNHKGSLVLTRSRLTQINDWKRPTK